MLQKHMAWTHWEKRREVVAGVKAVQTKDFKIQMQMALHAKLGN